MRRFVQTVVLVWSVFTLVACGRAASVQDATNSSPSSSAPPTTVRISTSPAPDFGFEFAYGACFTNRMNTFTQRYTKDMVTAPAITVTVTLPPSEMERIYQKMVEIDFFDYPSTYKIPIGPNEPMVITSAAMHYHFSVRNNAETKTVDWLDDIIQPTKPEADRLRELAKLMIKVIEARPEIQALPAPNAGCA